MMYIRPGACTKENLDTPRPGAPPLLEMIGDRNQVSPTIISDHFPSRRPLLARFSWWGVLSHSLD